MSGEPILKPCEGSGCRAAEAAQRARAFGVCSMCGRWHPMVDGVVAAHVRDDVLARLDRGDFDGEVER